MMTQQEATDLLEKILGRKLGDAFEDCTGDATTCPIEECMICGVRDCPENEPLHYHHDGCPRCSEEGA
jgi:hypothetical protein